MKAPLIFRRGVAGVAFVVLALGRTTVIQAAATFGQATDIFNVGAGARSLGMGGAFTGLADDASAPYYNPAGLAFLDDHQLLLMHAPLFLQTNYDYLSTAHPFGDKWGTVGFSDALLSSTGFDVRDQFNNLTSEGSLTDNALFGSYARKFGQSFSAGFNGKFIQEKIAGFSDSAVGYDLGFLYAPFPIASIGASFMNINSPHVTLQSSPDVFRETTRVGIASQLIPDRLTLTADLIKTGDEQKNFAAGFEVSPASYLKFRGGLDDTGSLTLGLGIALKTLRIDYAFSSTDLGAFNKVSVTWAWQNIYRIEMSPMNPQKKDAAFNLSGFENKIAFKTTVPDQAVVRWTLDIQDHDGKPVRTLQGDLRPPEHIDWDARNSIGEPAAEGVYFYRFTVEYRNGKSWTVNGTVTLALPHSPASSDVNMDIQLNGSSTLEVPIVEPGQGVPASSEPSQPPSPVQIIPTPVAPADSEPSPAQPPAQPDKTSAPAQPQAPVQPSAPVQHPRQYKLGTDQ